GWRRRSRARAAARQVRVRGRYWRWCVFPVGGKQPGLVGGEPCLAGATPEALVGDHELCRRAGQQVGQWLVLLLVRRHDRVAERQSALVGQKHQPHAPNEAVVRLAVAVTGKAGELGSPLAAWVAGDRQLGAVSEPDTASVEPADEPLLHDRDQPDQRPQATVVL